MLPDRRKNSDVRMVILCYIRVFVFIRQHFQVAQRTILRSLVLHFNDVYSRFVICDDPSFFLLWHLAFRNFRNFGWGKRLAAIKGQAAHVARVSASVQAYRLQAAKPRQQIHIRQREDHSAGTSSSCVMPFCSCP